MQRIAVVIIGVLLASNASAQGPARPARPVGGARSDAMCRRGAGSTAARRRPGRSPSAPDGCSTASRGRR